MLLRAGWRLSDECDSKNNSDEKKEKERRRMRKEKRVEGVRRVGGYTENSGVRGRVRKGRGQKEGK